MKEKIYYLAAIESIINKKGKTDLGNYQFEYLLKLSTHTPFLNEENISSALVLGVKLRNKITNKVEWVNLFYKILEKNCVTESAKNKFYKILNGSIYDQISFILKDENSIFGHPYISSGTIRDFDEFLEETPQRIHHNDGFSGLANSSFSFATVKLGGSIPNEVKMQISIELKRINEDLKEKSKIKILK